MLKMRPSLGVTLPCRRLAYRKNDGETAANATEKDRVGRLAGTTLRD